MPAAREADPLVIRRLEFLGGQASVTGWKPVSELPEIAFSGRSNVGKSSLLNTLVRRKALARVSSTPGKTREINFFRVNDTFHLVDLPGYGYARVSKAARNAWRPLIEGYLRTSDQLKGVVQLIDSRHPPSDDDHRMMHFLGSLGVPTIVVATKVDKLKRVEREATLAGLAEQLGIDDDQLIPFSAHTGEGRDELAQTIVGVLAQPSWREL